MSESVLTSSGFIISVNKWFIPLLDKESYRDSLLNTNSSLDLFPNLNGLIEKGGIHSSAQATEAYLTYINTPTFDNYLALIEIFTDVLGCVGGFKELAKLQVNNTYLSALGFKMVLELLDPSKMYLTYKDYAIVPSFLAMRAGSDSNELQTRKKRYETAISQNQYATKKMTMAALVERPEVFSSVFKFLLTDFNRGGSYV